jgi:hypothetical protein
MGPYRLSPGRRGRGVSDLVLSLVAVLSVGSANVAPAFVPLAPTTAPGRPWTSTVGPVANFSAAINRLVELVGAAGSGLLALVWTRVALSWFSNDPAKKVQAKDRARDALIGTLLFVAAVSGLVWALAHWVVTGS